MWVAKPSEGLLVRVLVAVGTLLLVAVLRGVFVAPAALARLPAPWRLVPE
jgi:hypothetical protein